MLTKAEKQEQFEQLREVLSGVNTLFLLQNRGLNVNQVNELRSKVRAADASYKVFKNSVVKLAIEGTGMEGITPHLTGPNAVAFTTGDGVNLGKAIRDFVKDHPQLTFRQAYLEGQVLDAEQAEQIADLPTRDELISKLLYILQSPIRRLAVALNSPIQKLASALHQVAEQRES